MSGAAGLNTAANAAANSDWRQDQTNTFIVVAPSTEGTWAGAQAVQGTANINHAKEAVNQPSGCSRIRQNSGVFDDSPNSGEFGYAPEIMATHFAGPLAERGTQRP